ncbi:MAG TPA: hypothetical protein VKB80_24535 [Kofleriaceae bacterium]|nr:hypothetical protein [Kofleriaceae bacterium]
MKRIAWTTMFVLALGAAAACGGDDDDTGGADAGGNADAGAGGDAGAAPSCTEYCTRITANCTGTNMQYTDMTQCMSYCTAEAWTVGMDSSSQTGNTLGCRQYHAGAAMATGDPATHCPHAGPTGGNQCGTACEVYCDNYAKNCTTSGVQYTDAAACQSACGAWTEGTPADQMGNTTYCRVYHSGVPAFTDATTHCPHAQENPTTMCVN